MYVYLCFCVFTFHVSFPPVKFSAAEEQLITGSEKRLNFNDVEDDIVCPSACYTDTSTP